MHFSALLTAAALAMGIQAQSFAVHDSLTNCLQSPALGDRFTCPSSQSCFVIPNGGWNTVSLTAHRTNYRVELFTTTNCNGGATRLTTLNSCRAPTSGNNWLSYRCTTVV